MKKKLSILAVALFTVSMLATSCGKKDKYHYMHKAVDLQKEWDAADKKGDAEKKAKLEKEIEENNKVIHNYLEEEAKQKAKEEKN